MSETGQFRGQFIDGEFVESMDGRRRSLKDPATGEFVAEVAEGAKADVDRAVAGAERAFQEGAYPALSAAERGRILWKVGDLLEERKEEIAREETLTEGKPLRESLGDVQDAADVYRYYAGLVDKPRGYTYEHRPDLDSRVVRVPIGVCGMIVPWNYPILISSWKIAPAIAAGNTCVLKPSSPTPLSALATAQAFRDAGLPPGVLQVVLGSGAVVGEALADHPGVRKIAFTGGTETGRRIMQGAAVNIKKLSLELGGKSPLVVFDDADVELAVDYALYAIYYNQGEVCSAGSRLIVQEGIHDEIVQEVARRAKEIRLGHGLDSGTEMGPLISASHREDVNRYVEIGAEEGAEVVTGATVPQDGALAHGYFYPPTLLTGCKPEMRVVQEEIFGPVLAVQKFKTEEEGVALANGTEYGLVAGVFTRDVARAHRVTSRIEAGVIWVNYYHPSHPSAPWGGFKQSGIGRELGAYAIDEYSETKSIHYHLNPKPRRFYTEG